MCKATQSDKEVMGGTAVFRGTRVPVSTLFDYLSESQVDDDPIKDFLYQFPTVKPEQVAEVLDYYRSKALSSVLDPTN